MSREGLTPSDYVADILSSVTPEAREERWERFWTAVSGQRTRSEWSKWSSKAGLQILRHLRLPERITELATDISLALLNLTSTFGISKHRERILVTSPAGDRNPTYLLLSQEVEQPEEMDVPNLLLSGEYVAAVKALLPQIADLLKPWMQLLKVGNWIGDNYTLEDLVDDILFVFQPKIVRAPIPKMKEICVPVPCITILAEPGRLSTAGILARDQEGTVGVTAAYHGTGPVGTPVQVGNLASSVTIAHEVHDIVFIPLPPDAPWPEMRGKNGVLAARPPWETEHVHFWGAVSGERATRVTSYDKGLPSDRVGRQLCVQTAPDTDEVIPVLHCLTATTRCWGSRSSGRRGQNRYSSPTGYGPVAR